MAEQRADDQAPVAGEGAAAGNDGDTNDDIQDRLRQQQKKMQNDAKDQQIAALIEATALVARLAAMDPERYKQETASSSCSNGHSASDDEQQQSINKSEDDDINASNAPSSASSSSLSSSSSAIQHQLDTMQTRWALEDTAIPSLAESIHRLQSALSLLEAEADVATSEIQSLQTALTESKSRERRLERAIRKLYAENERLRGRLVKRRQKSRAFVRNVKDAIGIMKVPALKRRDSGSASNNKDDGVADGAEINKDETATVVNQLKRHESALKECKRGSDASKEPLPPQPSHRNARQRTLTDSSLFSDIDESIVDSPFRSYNYDFDFDSGTCDASTDTTDEEQHDDEEGSITSTSSAPLVTEMSTPTVSLRATNSFPPNLPKIDSSSLMGDEEDMIERNVYTLRFPVGRSVGIELQRVPLSLEKRKVEVTADAIPLSDDSTHSYTFADAAAEVSSDIKAFGSLIGSVGKSALKGLAADEASEILGGTDESQHPDSAFLICGFAGFDSILNERPPLGSRLVSIDDVSLERGSWTFSSLKKCIQEKSSIESGANTFTMTFRADPLSVTQKSILDKAVNFSQKKADEENSASSTDLGESKDSQADEFLLVPSQPKLDGPLKTASSHSLRSSISRQGKSETKKSTEAPGPEEVKLAVKAFSKKLKSIM